MMVRKHGMMAWFLLLVLLSPLVSSFVAPPPQVVLSRWNGNKAVTPLNLSEVSEEDNPLEQGGADRTAGLLVLASVPLAWGTYGPVVKYVYEVQPAVPGIVFSAAYYIVASVVLNTLSALSNAKKEESSKDLVRKFPFQGGLELGSYLFVGNLLQVKGLETVPSGRAAFIVQLTTLIVPIMSAVMTKTSVSLRTWVACILAFAGVVIMGLDGKEVGLSLLASLSKGDLLIMAAAVLYSLHVVRLSRYATETTPLRLAASKATTEALLSIISISGLCLSNVGGPEVATFFSALLSGWTAGTITLSTLTPTIGAVLWTGLVTCAYTIYAQSFGQARVTPSEANLIYTIQPLFTACFAYLLLGETLGQAAAAGAVLIALAVYTVANQEDPGSGDGNRSEEVQLPLQNDKSTALEAIER